MNLEGVLWLLLVRPHESPSFASPLLSTAAVPLWWFLRSVGECEHSTPLTFVLLRTTVQTFFPGPDCSTVSYCYTYSSFRQPMPRWYWRRAPHGATVLAVFFLTPKVMCCHVVTLASDQGSPQPRCCWRHANSGPTGVVSKEFSHDREIVE